MYNEHRGTRKLETANQNTSTVQLKRWSVSVEFGERITGAVKTKSVVYIRRIEDITEPKQLLDY